MNPPQTWSAAKLLTLILTLASASFACNAQQPGHSDLKTVDNPGGGQFVYGSLTNQASKTSAMVYMLRMVHTHFGDKPQVGKFLQSRDGNSLATFFTVNAKTQGGRPVAGLVIISMPAKGDPQAAVLYDDAARFVSTEPSMMKSLTSAWKGSLGGSSSSGQSSGGSQAQSASRQSGSQQLYPATTGDKSAMVKMPQSWQLIRVAGGGLIAEGDRGEMVMMGIIFQNIVNPQNPQAQQFISGPMATRGPKVVCPLTANLFSDYVCAFNQTRRNNGKSQGTFNFVSSAPQGGGQGVGQPVVTMFTVDFHDGAGLRNGSVYTSLLAPFNPRAQTWAMLASMSNIPQKYGSAADPTLKAVVESYTQNAKVIASEGASDLNRIHQQGLANQAQTEAINSRRENSTKAYDSHMQTLKQNDAVNDQHNADIDWQSKINQDYILDRSVIRDTADTVHATTGNSLAEALVKSNPNQLEYVPNQQLVRGADY